MPSPDALTIRDYAAYLVGNRQAILRIATSKGAVFIGALFVLSAGFAREYDGADLRAEPWHLAIPFGASIATSFVLFHAVWLAGRKRRAEPMPFWKAYRGFLSLYWATAPLAWLYAIPVERMLPVLDAIRANYALLLIVSIWRVLLITRAIAVVNTCPFWAVLPTVTLISSIVVLAVSLSFPFPVLALMGGIRPPDDEVLTMSLASDSTCFALLAVPLSLIMGIAVGKHMRAWRFPRNFVAIQRVSASLIAFAVLSIIAWVPILPCPQGEQRNRKLVEQAVEHRQIAEAIRILCTHPRAEFPPHWRPPPWVTRSRHELDAILLLDEAESQGAPLWVIEAYHDATCRIIRGHLALYQAERAHYETLARMVEHDDEIFEARDGRFEFEETAPTPAEREARRAKIIAELHLAASQP